MAFDRYFLSVFYPNVFCNFPRFCSTDIFHPLQIWTLKPGWGSRPDIHVEKGHEDDITALKFSSDGQVLLSRSMDDTLKVMCLNLFMAFLPMKNTSAGFYHFSILTFIFFWVLRFGTCGK